MGVGVIAIPELLGTPQRSTTRFQWTGAGGGESPARRPGSARRAVLTICTWNAPHGLLEFKDGEIHLWRADLDRSTNALPALKQTLAPEELTKAGQFRLERDRNRYILAHGALRSILSRYLKTTAGEPMFRYGLQGKPALVSDAVRFNLSHSDDLVISAISRGPDVGVDVERVRPGVDEDVAGCVSPRALRFLEALPQPARRRAFFQAWTRMEAYSKARGEGLKSGLETFEVFLDLSTPGLPPTVGDGGRERRWWLQDFAPRRGYAAALAAQGEKCGLTFWKWQPRDRGDSG